MADHRRQVELAVPGRVGGHAGHPLDVGAPTRPSEHRAVRFEPDEPAGMPGRARLVQHAARTAAHVQDGVRSHHEVLVERVAAMPRAIPRVQSVIQGGGVSVGIHRDSIHDRPTAAKQDDQRQNERCLTRH